MDYNPPIQIPRLKHPSSIRGPTTSPPSSSNSQEPGIDHPTGQAIVSPPHQVPTSNSQQPPQASAPNRDPAIDIPGEAISRISSRIGPGIIVPGRDVVPVEPGNTQQVSDPAAIDVPVRDVAHPYIRVSAPPSDNKHPTIDIPGAIGPGIAIPSRDVVNSSSIQSPGNTQQASDPAAIDVPGEVGPGIAVQANAPRQVSDPAAVDVPGEVGPGIAVSDRAVVHPYIRVSAPPSSSQQPLLPSGNTPSDPAIGVPGEVNPGIAVPNQAVENSYIPVNAPRQASDPAIRVPGEVGPGIAVPSRDVENSSNRAPALASSPISPQQPLLPSGNTPSDPAIDVPGEVGPGIAVPNQAVENYSIPVIAPRQVSDPAIRVPGEVGPGIAVPSRDVENSSNRAPALAASPISPQHPLLPSGNTPSDPAIDVPGITIPSQQAVPNLSHPTHVTSNPISPPSSSGGPAIGVPSEAGTRPSSRIDTAIDVPGDVGGPGISAQQAVKNHSHSTPEINIPNHTSSLHPPASDVSAINVPGEVTVIPKRGKQPYTDKYSHGMYQGYPDEHPCKLYRLRLQLEKQLFSDLKEVDPESDDHAIEVRLLPQIDETVDDHVFSKRTYALLQSRTNAYLEHDVEDRKNMYGEFVRFYVYSALSELKDALNIAGSLLKKNVSSLRTIRDIQFNNNTDTKKGIEIDNRYVSLFVSDLIKVKATLSSISCKDSKGNNEDWEPPSHYEDQSFKSERSNNKFVDYLTKVKKKRDAKAGAPVTIGAPPVKDPVPAQLMKGIKQGLNIRDPPVKEPLKSEQSNKFVDFLTKVRKERDAKAGAPVTIGAPPVKDPVPARLMKRIKQGLNMRGGAGAASPVTIPPETLETLVEEQEEDEDDDNTETVAALTIPGGDDESAAGGEPATDHDTENEDDDDKWWVIGVKDDDLDMRLCAEKGALKDAMHRFVKHLNKMRSLLKVGMEEEEGEFGNLLRKAIQEQIKIRFDDKVKREKVFTREESEGQTLDFLVEETKEVRARVRNYVKMARTTDCEHDDESDEDEEQKAKSAADFETQQRATDEARKAVIKEREEKLRRLKEARDAAGKKGGDDDGASELLFGLFKIDFVLLYVFKFLRLGVQVLCIYVAQKVFQEMYTRQVHAESRDPPPLWKMLLTVLSCDAIIQVILLMMVVAASFLYKHPGNAFLIDDDFISMMIYENIFTTIFTLVVGWLIAIVIKKKKYFGYKRHGITASLAYRDMMIAVVVVMALIPFNVIFDGLLT